MPTVSIIVPCHNAASWLAAALESCLAQTGAALDIIVIDDGSTDDSCAIARRFEPQGVEVLAQPNRGASAARNRGLAAARGDFIQFLDADDLLAPGKIAAQLSRAAQEPAGTVFTGRWARFTSDPTRPHFHDANPLFADLTPTDYLACYASHDCMMHPGAWLVPRSVAELAGPWDERISLNDDGEYFARVVVSASRVAFCPGAVSLYRSALPASLSAQRSRRHLESAYLALQRIVDEMKLLADTPAMRRAAADLAQRFAYDYYPSAPDLVHHAEQLARSLGGASFQPIGGPLFQILRRLLGWKLTRRLQIAAGRFTA